MEILFGADEVTFWRINQRMSLQIAAHSKIMLPGPGRKRIRSLEELKESFPDIYEVIVDATEQRIQRPGDKRKNKKYRSGKKKAHTVKTQILVDATRGAILHVSETVEGKRHDFRLFKDTVTPMATGGSVRLLGDSGYQGIATQRPHLSAMTSRKRFRGAPPLTRKEKRANRLFARVRVRVEHAFARLKQFKVLAGTYRHTIRIYNVVFRSIATLTNFRLQMRTEVA